MDFMIDFCPAVLNSWKQYRWELVKDIRTETPSGPSLISFPSDTSAIRSEEEEKEKKNYNSKKEDNKEKYQREDERNVILKPI